MIKIAPLECAMYYNAHDPYSNPGSHENKSLHHDVEFGLCFFNVLGKPRWC